MKNKKPENIELGKRVIELRNTFGISSAKLSDDTGISTSVVSKLENAEGGVSHSTLYKIAQKYHTLNMNWLIKGEGSMLLPETKDADIVEALRKAISIIESNNNNKDLPD